MAWFPIIVSLTLFSVQEQLSLVSHSSVPNTFQFAGTDIAQCPILVALILFSVQGNLLLSVPIQCPYCRNSYCLVSHSSVPNTFQCAGTIIDWCPILVSLIISSVQEHLLLGVPLYSFPVWRNSYCLVFHSSPSSVEEQLLIGVPLQCFTVCPILVFLFQCAATASAWCPI